MIKSILIRNFQSHKDTYIDLSNGFNIINGPTDQGKSVIVRTLRWVFNNRPQGFTFQSHFAGNDPTIVTIAFDNDQFVTRYRSKTENYYSCSTHEKLEALRGNVPDEIKKIIQIEDINIQSQFDKIFLLDQTPSQVGKYLNEVLDLEIIDKANKNINSMVKENKRNEDTVKKEIDKLEQEINSLTWIDDFGNELAEAEQLQQSIHVSANNLKLIRGAYEIVIQKYGIAKRLDKLISVKDEVDSVLQLISELDLKKKELTSLQNYQNSLSEISLSKKKLETFISCTDKINEILIKNKEKEELRLKNKEITLLNNKSFSIELRLNESEKRIEIKKKEYLQSTRGYCPLCGNKTGDRI